MTNFEKIKIDFINRRLEEIEEIKKIPMSKIHLVISINCNKCLYNNNDKDCATKRCSKGLKKYLESEAK